MVRSCALLSLSVLLDLARCRPDAPFTCEENAVLLLLFIACWFLKWSLKQTSKYIEVGTGTNQLKNHQDSVRS